MELWGGHECSVNRVGDRYSDQTVLSGHHTRIDDLERFAELGLGALRYPALWERTAPSPHLLDFGWLDERLARMQALRLKPILGFVHHGSGPLWTNLLDPDFAPGLARYAAAVAQRFPWVEAYTPINEPLTTARFSCLYGHWYPHRRDERSTWIALLNQIDAMRLSMAAIRRVNPAARLVQTEDLGYCQSTPLLAYQADFENERRWLTWDLLTGRVRAGHPLHDHLQAFGLQDRLAMIADDPCPPDVVGVNYYPTSERFLDDAVSGYPAEAVGGNGRHRYVDVEAVRVSQAGVLGVEAMLRQACERYGLPAALTECHIGCTREEQLRWIGEAWQGAKRLEAKGHPVVAVTAWSLLGAYDWASLLTRDDGRYESGVFDLRGGSPRATALAPLLQGLASGGDPPPPAAGRGWWRRDVRATLGRLVRPCQTFAALPSGPLDVMRPVLITGASGTLGQALARACTLRGLAFQLTDRRALAIDDPDAIDRALDRIQPWAVINAAGWVRVDEAEDAEAACLRANADAVAHLAAACAARDLPLATFSSDLVFDGLQATPYVEASHPRPLGVYGKSKHAAEQAVLAAGARGLVIRTAAFFQEADPHNFAMQVKASLRAGRPFEAADDLVISPTYVPDLVTAALDLLIDGETGVWHLANDGAVTWADFARRIAVACGLDASGVIGRPAEAFAWKAKRPPQCALSSSRGMLLPPLADAIDRFAQRSGGVAVAPHANDGWVGERVA